jgi:glycosyltransferase involved in cell wall biosynthesis
MKVTAINISFNEQDYLQYALDSIYPIVDQIVIVEGCDLVSKPFATDKGLSIDRTGEIVQQYPDTGSKINYIPYGFCQDKNDLRQRSLEEVSSDTDYVLVFDGDFMYREEEIRATIALAEQTPQLRDIYAEHKLFFHDFHHILTVDQEKKKACKYHAPHFFWRYREGLQYRHQEVYLNNEYYWQSGSGVKEVTMQELQTGGYNSDEELILTDPQFAWYHFGWIRMVDRLDRHILQWFKMCIAAVKEGIAKGVKYAPGTEGGQWKSLIGKSDEEILEWIHAYHKLYTGIYDARVGERVEEYSGLYPDGIRAHPWWNFSKEEFGL